MLPSYFRLSFFAVSAPCGSTASPACLTLGRPSGIRPRARPSGTSDLCIHHMLVLGRVADLLHRYTRGSLLGAIWYHVLSAPVSEHRGVCGSLEGDHRPDLCIGRALFCHGGISRSGHIFVESHSREAKVSASSPALAGERSSSQLAEYDNGRTGTHPLLD